MCVCVCARDDSAIVSSIVANLFMLDGCVCQSAVFCVVDGFSSKFSVACLVFVGLGTCDN